MEKTYLRNLPSEIQKLSGRYRRETRFFNWFVNKYFIGDDPEYMAENTNEIERFRKLLEENNLKSKLLIKMRIDMEEAPDENSKEIKTKILIFRISYLDIITVDTLKQFMLFILPLSFDFDEKE